MRHIHIINGINYGACDSTSLRRFMRYSPSKAVRMMAYGILTSRRMRAK